MLDALVGTDVYLIDQLLKGRVARGARVIDVGAGGGRNLRWFLDNGFDVRAIEPEPAVLRELGFPEERLLAGPVEDVGALPGSGDLVISCAVLHFARDEEHFERMLRATWELVAPGGLFFCRLASTVGVEERVQPLGGGRYLLPDGHEWFLVDDEALLRWTLALSGELLDPIKSTVVQRMRTMTTWVMAKPPLDELAS